MKNIQKLLEVMEQLRDPQNGCPWDVEQDFASIAPYTIEEAYEVADAIARGNLHDLRDELGDLLLQVVFHARMAEEAGEFDFEDVAGVIADKMLRRHPHVFGKAFVARTVEQNVRLTIERIRVKSPILKEMEERGEIKIVGGVYALGSGKVTLL